MKDEYENEQKSLINEFMNCLVPAIITFSLSGFVFGLILGDMFSRKDQYAWGPIAFNRFSFIGLHTGVVLGVLFPFLRKLERISLTMVQIAFAMAIGLIFTYSYRSTEFADKVFFIGIIFFAVSLPIICNPIVFWLVNDKNRKNINN